MITNIIAQLQKHLLEVKPTLPNPLPKAERFKEDIGVDSLDMAEFVARVEQDYRIEIPDEDWPKIASLELMAQYISEHG